MRYRLGIVLSGGGVRGLAHVGVLKALTEAGVEPEALSGTSSGGIVAALYAAGYSADEMLEFFVEKMPFRFSKMTLAKPGIFDTEKVVADFLEYFPDDSFESLSKPVFLTATDLVEARAEVFSSGKLVRAILASASTPLVFAPTEIDGHWYSDGGITNNFPVEPLLGLCDKILGVHVGPLRNVAGAELRTAFAVSQRALEIGMYQSSKMKVHECDLLISPSELSRFGTFDTKHLQEILEVGFHAAWDQMESIKSLAE